MIRLAFLAVLALAGLLSFGAFFLARGGDSAGNAPDTPAPVAETETPAEPEPASGEQVFFLADLTLEGDDIAVLLFNAGPDGNTVVVRDADALRAAKDTALMASTDPASDASGEFVLYRDTTPLSGPFLQVYRDDKLIEHIVCPNGSCQNYMGQVDVDYAGLLDVAEPLIVIEEHYDSYTGYLDALAFVASEPDFALLDLQYRGNTGHPVPQTTPEAFITLPTMYRSADLPLNTETHGALLSALVQGVLPDGVTLTSIAIEEHGPAIVVDADNGLPATRAGAEIPFPGVLFYTPQIAISGAADLPADVLETLTNDTLSRVEFDDAAQAFIQGLGLTCSDCYNVRIKGDVYDEATVIRSVPESYTLSFYDLRDAP